MLKLPENLDAPWEPRAFAVGDRVQIRLSGECRTVIEVTHNDLIPKGERQKGHPHELDGVTGTVRFVKPRWDCDDGHIYRVYFDTPIQLREDEYIGAGLAALELEPLEAEW